jgi:Niemann-Pick C1 protein
LRFGPAFDKDFLIEVFQLQQELEQLGQNENKGMEKLCFSPMVQVGETTKLSQCTVQSVFGYFGNNFDTFNKTAIVSGYEYNYLDVLANCLVNLKATLYS